MRKINPLSAGATGLSLLGLCLLLSLLAGIAAGASPLPDKPVLAYLLNHAELTEELAAAGWTEPDLAALGAVVTPFALELEQLRLDSDLRVRLGVHAGDIVVDEVTEFNRQVRLRTKAIRERLHSLLGGTRWAELEAIAAELWQRERERSAARWDHVTGPHLAYTVFCTQYAAETAWEIAVPDAYVKFANRDWSYEPGYPDGYYGVRLTRDTIVVEDVPVWDVGPWNIDDNYWNEAGGDPRPRRLFTDLPRGRPEAEAAFFDNYNGGLDQFGRTVLNPGGCDLSFDVATALGLAFLENDWIQVEYKWEDAGGGGTEFIFDNPSVNRLTGDWITATSAPDKYGSDYYWTSTGTADPRLCIWKIDLTEAGTYDVAFWWSEGGNRTPGAELGLKQTALQLFSENQQTNGGRWNSVGTFSFGAGTVRVGMRNGGPPGWVVVCDAIRLTKLG